MAATVVTSTSFHAAICEKLLKPAASNASRNLGPIPLIRVRSSAGAADQARLSSFGLQLADAGLAPTGSRTFQGDGVLQLDDAGLALGEGSLDDADQRIALRQGRFQAPRLRAQRSRLCVELLRTAEVRLHHQQLRLEIDHAGPESGQLDGGLALEFQNARVAFRHACDPSLALGLQRPKLRDLGREHPLGLFEFLIGRRGPHTRRRGDG